jgi:NADPH:quinone reductase-like Zn-dependent oxidoreductase
VNPVDKILYGINIPDFVLGFEGSGVIIKVGEDVSQDLVGKKVAFTDKAYARYAISDLKRSNFLSDDFDLSKAANLIVNPLTAVSELLET